MRLIAGHQREQQPRLFSARQVFDLGFGAFLGKPEPAELSTDRLIQVIGPFAGQFDKRRRLQIQFVGLVLGKIPDP